MCKQENGQTVLAIDKVEHGRANVDSEDVIAEGRSRGVVRGRDMKRTRR